MMNWREITEKLTKGNPLQSNILARLTILTYNLGDLVKAVYYALHYGEGIHDRGYRAEIKIALADTLAQLKVLIHYLGFSEEEIERLAYERLQEFISKRLKR